MSKELNNLISALSEDNFKKLVQEYLKEKYKTPHVRIVDGPYDGGNDLEILIGETEIRKNIQVTVQKTSIEKKLDEDLEKSKQNVTKYEYQKSLDFYISQNISKDKRNELELHAEVDYGIQLKIIDGNILSQEAEKYKSIHDFTYQAHNIQNDNLTIADKQTKILFDVLTLDKNSVEIKKNFINSYIFSYLFTCPDSTLKDIFGYINPHLNNTLHIDYLEKELNYLRLKQQLISPTDKKKYQLSEDKKSDISAIFSNVSSQEASLKEMIDGFINKNNIKCTCDELVGILYKLYRENYTIDIEELKNTNNSFSASIRKIFNDLTSFFTKKGIPQSNSKTLATELLKLCNSNEYLNKLSSIHLFTNLYSSDKLEKYINGNVKEILIDTQILIRIICILFNEKFDYSDTALQSVKILLNTFTKFKDKVKLISTYDYVGEVVGHMMEALKLQRFMNLPIISKLGNSKNVFYNVFLELKRNDILDEETDFYEFISEIVDEEIGEGDEDLLYKLLLNKIEEILQLADIELIYHPTYQNYLAIKREYEIALANASKERSYNARENDLRTILYLATKENHVNEETGEMNEPFLVTFDSAFYIFRKKLLDAHKTLSFWYIYSPLKIVDRLSVMNFTVNPQSINLNIIALTETNFNYSSKTTSFLDVISSFFYTNDVSKLSIINKLAKLKKSSQNVDEVPVVDEFKDREDDNLTTLLLNLRNHYHTIEAKYKFDDVVQVFEIPKFENNIISIFESSLKDFKTTFTWTFLFDRFDALIETSKKEE